MAKKPTEKAAEEKEAPKKTAAKKTTTKTAAKTTTKKATAQKVTEKKAPVKKAEKVAKVEEAVQETSVEETPKPTAKTTDDVAVVKEKKSDNVQDDFLANFNWENYQEGIDVIESEELKKFEKLVEENFIDTTDEDVVIGKVVYMTDREAIIDINAKSEGVISLNEFRYNPDLKVGDKVEVVIDTREDRTGQLVLSHRKARVIKAWDRVNNAHDNSEIVNGFVKCRTKGGMIVDVFGIEAFLPGSQIDVKPIRDYDQYVNKTMEFKVVKINHEFKNVVVSHKALIEADIEEQKKEIIGQLEKGQVLEGIVKNITSYGVFIDLGGVDGLIHITDLSWSRIIHPSEILELDQKLNVVILDFDDNKSRIQLGLKQLSAHPWDKLSNDLKEGDKVKGKVVVIADYGAFIEIEEGVEGLVHVSEITWANTPVNAKEFFKLGDEHEAKIVTLDKESRKMSLSIKQLSADPWNEIDAKFPEGSRHAGLVKNITNYGVFIELAPGIGGMIHISDLSWLKRFNHPTEYTKVGQNIDVMILGIDRENRKLQLGHKQLEEDPWNTLQDTFAIGSIHEGLVTRRDDKGATIQLPYGLEGFAPNRHLAKEDGKNIAADETASFMVIEFDRNEKRIVLSHTRIWEQGKVEEAEAVKKEARADADKTKKAVKNIQSKVEKATLGDLGVLADLKKKMEGGAEDKAAE